MVLRTVSLNANFKSTKPTSFDNGRKYSHATKSKSKKEKDNLSPYIHHIKELKNRNSTLQTTLTDSQHLTTELQKQILELNAKIANLEKENIELRNTHVPVVIEQELPPSKCLTQETIAELQETQFENFNERAHIDDDLQSVLELRQCLHTNVESEEAEEDNDFMKPTNNNYKRIYWPHSNTMIDQSNVSMISNLQRKYTRSSNFPHSNELELPIKLFDCALAHNTQKTIEIDVVKVPSSKDVRIRVRGSNSDEFEDLDIRDVYANLVDHRTFHLETFDRNYYLISKHLDIDVKEIVDDIKAFQSDGKLPER